MNRLVLMLASLGAATLMPMAGAAQETEEGTIPRKATKAKKKKIEKGTDPALDAADEGAPVPSPWFPDWGVTPFGHQIYPVVGFAYRERDGANQVQYELGIGGGLNGIPLHSGNPGAYLNPRGGYAWGQVRTHVDGLDTDTVSYNRYWIGNTLEVPVRWFRYSLGLDYGKIAADEKAETVQKLDVSNDFGVLLLPVLSGHFTHSYGRLYGDSFDTKYEVSNDFWVHGRFFIEKFSVDFGPGVAFVKNHLAGGETFSSSLTYFRGLGRWDIFWKLGAAAHARYVVFASEDSAGSGLEQHRDPTRDLNAVARAPAPLEDSFDANLFIGLQNLFGGVGLGWSWNVMALHALERGNHERETTRRQGFGLVYQGQF